MSPDDRKQAWQAQTSHTRLRVDADLLLREMRRNQRWLTATIFWRDVREVGVSLLLVPAWLYLGRQHSLPWTWYLTVPVLLWIAGYLVVDRRRYRQQAPEPGATLCQQVESALRQVEHQIWLLGNVHWWYLLPLALSILAFLAQVTWQTRSAGWAAALTLTGAVALAVVVLTGVYRLNQTAVRRELDPRRQELEALLGSLKDTTPPANG